MIVDNLMTAVASEDMLLGALVVVESGICRIVRLDESVSADDLYSVVDASVTKGQQVRLSGKNTVFHIGLP